MLDIPFNEINYIKHFQQKLFSIDGEHFKNHFYRNLNMVKADYEFGNDPQDDAYLRGFGRLMIGYRGIGKPNGIYCGASSIGTFESRKNTYDHIMGATLTGSIVINSFKKSGLNIDFMVDQWLKDNLYLWFTIKVTQKNIKLRI